MDSMDKYISQLIDDIQRLVNDKTEIESIKLQNIDGETAAEQFLNGDRHNMQYILGISKEVLPHESRLNDNQISKLLNSLQELFEHHNYDLAYPSELTNRVKYKLLYDKMESKQPKTNYGRIGIEFCYYNEDECPIPGECDFCQQPIESFDKEDNIDISDWLPDGVKKEQVNNLNEEYVRETARSFVPSKKNIEGIFNYCDRWCERCLFTEKCTSFEMEKEMGMHENQSVEDALKYVSIMFEETGRRIEEDMERFGIDISDLPEINDEELKENEEHPIEKLSVEYMKSVSDWLDSNNDLISEHRSHLWNVSQKQHDKFDEIFNVITWYMTMIPVKINRALKPKDRYDDDEFYYNDKNATGRLVLDCISKSTNAFVLLMDFSIQDEDELIGFLAMLAQIKSGIVKELPDAKTYVRNGLDE